MTCSRNKSPLDTTPRCNGCPKLHLKKHRSDGKSSILTIKTSLNCMPSLMDEGIDRQCKLFGTPASGKITNKILMTKAPNLLVGWNIGDQSFFVCKHLYFPWHTANIHPKAVYLQHPNQRIVIEITRQTPVRVKLNYFQHIADLSGFICATALLDAKNGA